MKYIVFGNGRTGSLLLTSIMAPNEGAIPLEQRPVGGVINGVSMVDPRRARYNKTVDYFDNVVIHTHYIDKMVERLGINPEEWNLIISDRKNRFNQMMSFCMSSVTGEYYPYTDRVIEPFVVDVEKFCRDYPLIQSWPYSLGKHKVKNKWLSMPWKSKIKIDFEDLVIQKDIPQFVADRLGLGKPAYYGYQITQPSPRSYKDYILNWEELYNISLKIDKEIPNDRNY